MLPGRLPDVDLEVWRQYRAATELTVKRRLAEKLVRDNFPLIVKLVGQLSRRGKAGWKRGLDKDRKTPDTPEISKDLSAPRREQPDTVDLMQAGCIGFVRALDKYDPSKGGIAAYSKHWIRHEIQQCTIHDTTIYMPKGTGLPRVAYLKAEKIRQDEGREPTPQELGISQAQYDAWKLLPGIVGSLQDLTLTSHPGCGGAEAFTGGTLDGEQLDFESVTANDGPTPEDALGEAEQNQLVREWLDSLEGRERQVMHALFVDDIPIPALAKRLGMSVSAIIDMRDNALAQLREEMEDA